MALKRMLSEFMAGGGDMSLIEDDDGFLADALKDQKEYCQEIEAERKAREEARKANRRYIKGKKKKEKRVDVDGQQFHKLRRRLKLSRQEAQEIQGASIESLGQRRRQSEISVDEEFASGTETEDDDEEEELVNWSGRASALNGGTKVTVEQVESSCGGHASSESDSEEELITLSLPPKRKSFSALPSRVALDTSQRIEDKSFPSTKDTDVEESSDEEVITLSFTPLPSGHIKPKSATQSAGSTESQSFLKREDETQHAKVEIKSAVPTRTYFFIADDACRPAFSLLSKQLEIGPLYLDNDVKVPASINRFLRDYQREGIKFFYRSYKEGRGGLLGDDMGLGKTIQVIGFLSAIMKKEGKENSDFHRRINSIRAGRMTSRSRNINEAWPTCLIICPASVMTNWQNELDTWGYFEHALLDEDSMKDFERGRLDILITSHQTAKLRIERLNDQHISVVIVDECHALKNPASYLTKSLNSLTCKVRFGLTGTAIQNRFEEFWTLLDWSNPNEVGLMKDWQQLVAEPIRKGQLASASLIELAQGRKIAEQLKYCLLPTFFLRRTKALIKAQLPDKRDNIVFCPLTPLQIESYKIILNDPQVQFIRRAKEPCDCGAVDEANLPYQRCRCCYQQDEEGKRWNHHMLKYIMLLQRCSNHLALVFPDPQDNIAVTEDSPQADQMRKFRYLRQISIVKQLFPHSWETKQNNKLNGFRKEYCGKWLVLRNLMQEWKKNSDKVLLFSLNLRLLDWIAYFVEMEGYRHVRLDGSTPQKKRQSLVDDFNRDANIFIFLISTTAGGTGLNLTGANKVVIFDPHWNPAHDLQAMDRAYRFGQTRDVDVYRLIGKGSLEETIYDRQVHKQQMSRIGYDASKERRYFEPGDAKGFVRLFELHEMGNVTKDIIKACDLTEATFAIQHLVEDAEVGKVKAEAGSTDLEGLMNSQDESRIEDDPIAKLLQMTGVEYSHNNDTLLGGSRAETAMSRKAKESMALLQGSQRVKRQRVASSSSSSSRLSRKPKGDVPDIPAMTAWPPIRSTASSRES